jgi:hypothetical protein
MSQDSEGVGREAWMRPVGDTSAGKLVVSIISIGSTQRDLESHFLYEAAIEEVQRTFVSRALHVRHVRLQWPIDTLCTKSRVCIPLS